MSSESSSIVICYLHYVQVAIDSINTKDVFLLMTYAVFTAPYSLSIGYLLKWSSLAIIAHLECPGN